MNAPKTLFPDAKPGEIYMDVQVDGRLWVVAYERVGNEHGLEALTAESLFRAIGLVHPNTWLRFRVTYWDLATTGVSKVPGYGIEVFPGDTLDGTDLFALLLASVEPGAVMEWRATGPKAEEVIARIQAWFGGLNIAGIWRRS